MLHRRAEEKGKYWKCVRHGRLISSLGFPGLHCRLEHSIVFKMTCKYWPLWLPMAFFCSLMYPETYETTTTASVRDMTLTVYPLALLASCVWLRSQKSAHTLTNLVIQGNIKKSFLKFRV